MWSVVTLAVSCEQTIHIDTGDAHHLNLGALQDSSGLDASCPRGTPIGVVIILLAGEIFGERGIDRCVMMRFFSLVDTLEGILNVPYCGPTQR
jgi:hypothetical protein